MVLFMGSHLIALGVCEAAKEMRTRRTRIENVPELVINSGTFFVWMPLN